MMVVAMMVVAIVVSLAVAVAVPATEQPGAEQIDHQADHRDQQRLAIIDRLRREQALHALIENSECDRDQPERRCEARETSDLARSPAINGIGGALSGEGIGQSADPQRQRVRRHVPAVGGERHRTG